MARAGQKFKLECQVSGVPTPTLTWFHNNKPVKETADCKVRIIIYKMHLLFIVLY